MLLRILSTNTVDYSIRSGPFLRFSMRFEFLSEMFDHSVCETRDLSLTIIVALLLTEIQRQLQPVKGPAFLPNIFSQSMMSLHSKTNWLRPRDLSSCSMKTRLQSSSLLQIMDLDLGNQSQCHCITQTAGILD